MGYEMKTAQQLIEEFNPESELDLARETYFPSGLPDARYASILLSDLPEVEKPHLAGVCHEKGKKDISGCRIWFPAGSKSKVMKLKFQVLVDSPNWSFYFIQVPEGMTFKLNGPDHSVLNFSGKRVSANIRCSGGKGAHYRGCRVVLGENAFIASARVVLLNTDLLIGHNALWSDEILVQGSNQHGIVALPEKKLVQYSRNRIEIEPHVWVGRRAIVSAGARLGTGSVVGTGALVAKPYPPTCIIGGNPGRIIKRNRTWAFNLDKIEDRELEIIDSLPVFEESKMSWWARLTNRLTRL